jgi:pimeloyl-ACP methyl ester carboxylesterase
MTERRYTRVGQHRVHSVHLGTGPDLVLLHGLSGSHRWWRYNLDAFALHYRVHVPERVGFGASRVGALAPRLGLPELTEVMAGWLAALEIRSPRLIGHSMGGQIAIHLVAARHVELAALVLVSASGMRFRASVPELTRFLAGALPPRAWGAPLFLPTIAVDALRAGPRTLLRAGVTLLADDVRPLLAEVRCPTLVVWGALDPLLPVRFGRRMAATIPGARLVVLEDAGHNPMADQPARFNRAVLDFLAGARTVNSAAAGGTADDA